MAEQPSTKMSGVRLRLAREVNQFILQLPGELVAVQGTNGKLGSRAIFSSFSLLILAWVKFFLIYYQYSLHC